MGALKYSASADYGLSGQYIARIRGRNSKYTFNREFIGRKGGKRGDITSADVDEPGLYEECDVTKRGKVSRFYVQLALDENEHEARVVSKDLAMQIGKLLDSGEFPARVHFTGEEDVEILSAKQADKAQQAQTNSEALEICCAALQFLPPGEAKKVLAELRKRLNPSEVASEAREVEPPDTRSVDG